MPNKRRPWHAAIEIALALLAADFITTAFHWYEDTYLPWTDTPGFLGDIARDNDMHHAVPFAITGSSWMENLQVPFVMSIVIFGAAWLACPSMFARYPFFFSTLFVATTCTNVLHRFQHERDCNRPAVITWLQRAGILVSREQHTMHHSSPHQKYSVFLGFTNGVYDSIGVWKGLESVLSACGVRPVPKMDVDAYKAAVWDPWLVRNMERDCPRTISRRRMEKYTNKLARAHREGFL